MVVNVNIDVLIPLLVDDPLWVHMTYSKESIQDVLIPLLVDDPLWGLISSKIWWYVLGLNPSFSG